MSRRLAAIVALVVGTATVVLAVVLAVTEFPRGLGLLGCVVLAGAAVWWAVLPRGVARWVGYAEAVQHEGYRNAKLRTLLDTVPDVVGPRGEGLDLRWSGPDGEVHRSGAVILVSNNRYRLGRVVGSGTRPRLDDGVLGMAVIGAAAGPAAANGSPRGRWRQWSAPTFEVDSDRPVPAGIDGEALKLDPPLRFGVRPGVLRVRIAPAHPGASPSAMAPNGAWAGVLELGRIAVGRDQKA